MGFYFVSFKTKAVNCEQDGLKPLSKQPFSTFRFQKFLIRTNNLFVKLCEI